MFSLWALLPVCVIATASRRRHSIASMSRCGGWTRKAIGGEKQQTGTANCGTEHSCAGVALVGRKSVVVLAVRTNSFVDLFHRPIEPLGKLAFRVRSANLVFDLFPLATKLTPFFGRAARWR